MGGWFLENDNFIPANNLVTPAEIKPVWYFTPFYAILRVIPSKGSGCVRDVRVDRAAVPGAVAGSRCGEIDSLPRTGYKIALGIFAVTFVLFGAIGAGKSAEWIPDAVWSRRRCFRDRNALWLAVAACSISASSLFLWAYTHFGYEKTKPVPERVTTHE